jgi:primary-amine oxidase
VTRPAPLRTDALDPLDAEEIAYAADVARAHAALGGNPRFAGIALHEAAPDRRTAEVLAQRTEDHALVELVVTLDDGEVVAAREVPGAHPPVRRSVIALTERAVRADARWQAALHARGVERLEDTELHPWPPGTPDPEHPGQRISHALTYLKHAPDDNVFAHPVEGLIVTLDLDTGEVLRVTDTGVVPIPRAPGRFTADAVIERDDVRPIAITQPEGASFSLQGRRVRWLGFDLRVGFTPREGIVLHDLRHSGRAILRRASLSEMWVPYGDPGAIHAIKDVFDEGEIGLGALANSLRLGCDCLGEIAYLDAVVADEDGRPVAIENAICIHEEDTGVAWKHTDDRTGAAEIRRGRRLVVSSFSTIGNYDYGFFWYLHADGSIAYEVKLTGVIATGAVAPGERPAHGTLVAPGLHGPHHLHVFNVRLDVAVDGTRNTVVEVDSVADPAGPGNPVGTAWRTRRSPLRHDGGHLAEPGAARTWLVENPASRNAHGDPVAFQLLPGPPTPPLFAEGSPALRRAHFATRSVWVTAHDPAERYAAGDHPWHSAGGDGLEAYASRGRPIEDEDVVLWHTFAAHHVVRPEDWPVMPVTTTGFSLRPFGFFDRNPALDLPRPSEHACHAHGADPVHDHS